MSLVHKTRRCCCVVVPFLLSLLSLLSQMAAAAPGKLSVEQSRHFLIRTGFSPTESEVNAVSGRSAAQVVAETLLRARGVQVIYPSPDFVSQPPPVAFRFLKTQQEQQAMRQLQMREGLEIKTWWMREMLETRQPLKERMVLFWHNHFATSQQKVVRSQAMWAQHQLLRSHALGSFSTFLHAIAKDPAMLVYLDGANSRQQAPNENFAREVMELFTLGSTYSEQDIREAARAFTGWSIDRDDFQFKFRPAFHDSGVKTVLGRSGRFDGDDVLNILLEEPATARWIVSKLWREFVSPTPDINEIERISRLFRQSGYEISVAMRELLLSDAFWSEANRGSLIKSPIELVVGTVRQFELATPELMPLVIKSAQLGQNLLVPPNVKGWPGYTEWINATTLLERKRFTEQILRDRDEAMLKTALDLTYQLK